MLAFHKQKDVNTLQSSQHMLLLAFFVKVFKSFK